METYKIILFGMSIILFLTYFILIYLKFGIQKSISDSYYKLKRKDQWIFTIAIWGFAFPLVMIGVEIHPIFFFAATFIMFVGAAPAFRRGHMELKVHMVGAIGGISLAMLGFILAGFWETSLILILISLSLIWPYRIKNQIWWIETLMFLGTWIGLLIAN